MACYGCPYLQNYDVIWRDASDPTIMCVMLWCCAGPELQIRRGDEIVVDEFFPTGIWCTNAPNSSGSRAGRAVPYLSRYRPQLRRKSLPEPAGTVGPHRSNEGAGFIERQRGHVGAKRIPRSVLQ